ncbi:hypothetical protein CEXT_390961 [Caerostris extrusa]|uniref:Secreted protein n=1 Tax=Caerostris extrusa TaxID=172846 RepID=A0AAV4RQA4_CAEEX|nr:hypothetical protein CEXT_390961 [Caerostris extrusa]
MSNPLLFTYFYVLILLTVHQRMVVRKWPCGKAFNCTFSHFMRVLRKKTQDISILHLMSLSIKSQDTSGCGPACTLAAHVIAGRKFSHFGGK